MILIRNAVSPDRCGDTEQDWRKKKRDGERQRDKSETGGEGENNYENPTADRKRKLFPVGP